MNNSKLKVLKHFESYECCIFCKTNLIDPILYGTIYKYEDIITHYFCLLLSSNIMQKGSDQDGILGFLSKDIKKEVSRGRRLFCTYCRKHGASIGCAVKACKIMFHLPCGIANDAQNLFYDNFSSFCSKHRSLQYIPLSKHNTIENTACLICLDSLSLSFTETVWASCCKTAFYHKRCIQKVAIHSGYYFRCPGCNDNKLFRRQMLNSGIYIPDQDASWEFEPDAFSGLNERYSRCDAAVCRCPRGRDICHSNGYWQIILCYRCLRRGIHRKCGRGFIFKEQWACSSPSCLNESTVESTNTNKLYFRTMPQCSSGKMMSNLQLLACKSTENKENSDPNSSSSGLSIHQNKQSNAQHTLNMFNRSKRLFMDRKSIGSSSFRAGISHLGATTARNSFQALSMGRSVVSSIGRKHKKRTKKLNTCGEKCKNTCNARRHNRKKIARNVKNCFQIIGRRRRKYFIDREVVRVYPFIMKNIKDFEINL